MTERTLPAISLPVPGGARTETDVVVLPGAAVARRPAVAIRRREALITTPARAGMLIGASAAAYAVTLAGIAALQSSSDAAIAAHRQQWVDEVAAARAANDAVEATLRDADQQATWVGGVYTDVGNEVAAYQARLDELAALVAEVRGSAAALPTRISLPTVVTRSAVSAPRSGGGGTKAPSTSAKTTASGG